MSIVTIQIYRPAPSSGRSAPPKGRTLLPDNLLRTVQLQIESGKPLNKERAKRAVAQALPEIGKPWFMWEHKDGWIDWIDYDGDKAWVLVCRHTTNTEA